MAVGSTVKEIVTRLTLFDFLEILYWPFMERDMGLTNIIVDADSSPSDKLPHHNEVRVSFGFPGCGCVITEIALWPEHVSEEDAVEQMLQRCDAILKQRPFCPKCGHGLVNQIGAA